MPVKIQDVPWDVVGAVGAGVDVVVEAAKYLVVPIFCHTSL